MKIYKHAQIGQFLEHFESRRSETSQEVESVVADILTNVKRSGDGAVKDFVKKFDNVDLNVYPIQVTEEELEKAHSELDPGLLDILRESRANIKKFHEQGLPQSRLSWEENNVILGQRVTPIERVGVYVPGGRAAYPSSLLMGVVPAQVAGVSEIYVTTPCDSHGRMNSTILAAAYELGVNGVFRIGGAHGIGAFAYGTESVPRVDKIVGPGNIYVATAKKLLYGQCGIDMVAGPSEVLIIADESASAEYVAADLLAQAEHDPLASAILVTDSAQLAQDVSAQATTQLQKLTRAAIINQALDGFGGIILMQDIKACIEFSNQIAPEHLGLHVTNPWDILGDIKNAGAIFLGHYSPEAVGDYWAGPNHVLPTNGSARFFSPLRAEDFLKISSIISYSQQAINLHGEKIKTFAKAEGLDAHAASIDRRMA